MKLLAKIFYILLSMLDDWQRKREQKKIQRSRDALEDNPHRWFRDKFGGVRDLQDRKDKPVDPDSKSDKS